MPLPLCLQAIREQDSIDARSRILCLNVCEHQGIVLSSLRPQEKRINLFSEHKYIPWMRITKLKL